MSLRCLKDSTLPVLVPDELESFLYVLLYNAVRFLLHNIDDTPEFVRDYFDNASVNVKFSLGAARGSVIVSGGQDLEFYMPQDTAGIHPMNDLLAELFKLFSARYRVLQWELASQRQEGSLAPKRPLNAANGHFDIEAAEDEQSESTPDSPSPLPQNKDTSNTTVTPSAIQAAKTTTNASRPAEDDFMRAKSLDTHQVVIDIFARIVRKGEWPQEQDTVPDRLFGYRQAPRASRSTSDKPYKQSKTAPVGGPSARLARAGRGATQTRLNVLSE